MPRLDRSVCCVVPRGCQIHGEFVTVKNTRLLRGIPEAATCERSGFRARSICFRHSTKHKFGCPVIGSLSVFSEYPVCPKGNTVSVSQRLREVKSCWAFSCPFFVIHKFAVQSPQAWRLRKLDKGVWSKANKKRDTTIRTTNPVLSHGVNRAGEMPPHRERSHKAPHTSNGVNAVASLSDKLMSRV